MRDLNDALQNHRGPFRLCVSRPHVKKAGFSTTEWLSGSVERDDVLNEARALIDDPRDTIKSVSVFSETEGQFVFTLTWRYFEARAALAS